MDQQEPGGSKDQGSWSWCRVDFDEPTATIVVRERIRLADTDSSGRIYYGTVTEWFNRAQAELWFALGFNQAGLLPTPMMPVVNANVSYRAALVLGDQYSLRAWIEAAGRTSLTVGFEVTKDDVVCVEATMTHVHLDPATMEPAALPRPFIDAARRQR
ncbi:MAG: acyl-CoA thioesterase [Acidimicrobiales bacterium]